MVENDVLGEFHNGSDKNETVNKNGKFYHSFPTSSYKALCKDLLIYAERVRDNGKVFMEIPVKDEHDTFKYEHNTFTDEHDTLRILRKMIGHALS